MTRADFEWQYFRAGGKGGQGQNKRSVGVRCSHPPSGSTAEARDQRSQWQNRQAAFRRCVEQESFKKWLKRRTSGAVADLVEFERKVAEAVAKDLEPDNLLIEIWDGKKWMTQ